MIILILIVASIMIPSVYAQPQIQVVSIESVNDTYGKISWTTSEESATILRYGTDKAALFSAIDSNYIKNHTATIKDLAPNTKYYVEIVAANRAGNQTVDNSNGNYYSLTTYPTIEISEINVSEIGLYSARITWKTNADSTSVVHYGDSAANLDRQEMSSPGKIHSVAVNNLLNGTKYYFKAESFYKQSAVRDFTTKWDITPPFIEDVNIPETTNKQIINLHVSTEPFSSVLVYIDGSLARSKATDETGNVTFLSINLHQGSNAIKIKAKDRSENEFEKEFTTIVDSLPPSATLADIPSQTTQNTIKITGTVSEKSKISISVNSQLKTDKETDNAFELDVGLAEGDNDILITITDGAGNSYVIEKQILSDTKAPKLDVDITSYPPSYIADLALTVNVIVQATALGYG